jgi:hypothetical protein
MAKTQLDTITPVSKEWQQLDGSVEAIASSQRYVINFISNLGNLLQPSRHNMAAISIQWQQLDDGRWKDGSYGIAWHQLDIKSMPGCYDYGECVIAPMLST